MGRFLNADAFTSTGQSVLGTNMFVYCGNNPVNRGDSTGQFWKELWDTFTQTIQQASGYFAVAAGVSQVDTPVPGPADLISGVLLAGGVIFCAGMAVINTLDSSYRRPAKFNSPIKSTEDELSEIASRHGTFECVQAAESMRKHLENNNQHGEILTIQFCGGRGYVWSDIRCDTIRTNGIHVGVKYDGMVYCNVHPFGLPEVAWINDFHGTGTKIVTRTPF